MKDNDLSRAEEMGLENMELPNGYRLLRTAPGVWVLVELYYTGRVVARYEDELEPGRVEKDAREDAEKRAKERNY